MRLALAGCLLACAVGAASAPAPAVAAPRPCSNPNALGVARVVEIDASKGHVYGSITKLPTLDVLRPKEVVLTFDDGPLPAVTRPILDILDQHCTRATFFLVGKMAAAYPELVREEITRGHTIGTHTWSHPMPMRRLTHEAALGEIEKGIEEVQRAARGAPIAPFFRFPGLGDGPETVGYLKSRGVATFTVDIVSNDSFIRSPRLLVDRTMRALEARGSGILLFHDIKPQTQQALPIVLDELKRRGYQVVHLKPKGAPAVAMPQVPAAPVRPPTLGIGPRTPTASSMPPMQAPAAAMPPGLTPAQPIPVPPPMPVERPARPVPTEPMQPDNVFDPAGKA